METNEIFEKLNALRSRLEAANEGDLDGVEYAMLYDVAKALGLSEEQAKCLAGDPISEQPAKTIAFTMDFQYQYGNNLVISDRKEYERLCAEAGIEVMSDRDILNSYALAYAEYNKPEWDRMSSEQRCHQVIGAAYQKYLQNAAKAAKVERKADYPDGRRLDCGCVAYFKNDVMNASLGTSCPACYNRMSA